MKNSIRRDLSVRIGLVIFCISIGIGIASYFFSIHYHEKRFSQIVENQTKYITDTFTLQLWLFDLNTTKELCKLIFESPEVSGLKLLNQKKEIIFEKKPPDETATILFSKELRYQGKKTVGYLDIFYTNDTWSEYKKNIFSMVILITIGTVLGAFFFITILLNRYLSKPLENLQKSMGLLEQGNFHQSSLVRQKFEIQSIIDTFNKMAVGLQDRDEKLNREILERKQTEKALLISEKNLKSIYTAADDVAFIVTDLAGEDTKILDFSPGAEKVFGYSRNEIIGEKVGILHTSEDIKNFSTMQTALGNQEKYSGEVILVRKSGERFPALFTVYPKVDEIGNLIGTIGVSIDITERKQEEERYKTTIESSIDGFCIVDTKGRFQDVNHAYCDMVGYSRNELLSMSLMEIEALESAGQTKKRMEKIVQIGNDRFESRHRHNKGTLIDVEISTNYTPDKNGLFFVFLRDITERKRKQNIQESQIKLMAYASSHSSSDLLTKFLDEAELLTESKIGFYHFYNDKDKMISLQAWSTNTTKICKTEELKEHYPIAKAGVWVDCAQKRKSVIHNNYDRQPGKRGLPKGHVPITRELVVPVIREDKIVAILGLGNKNEDYHKTDIRTVQELADLAWETVSRKRTEELLYENEKLLRTIGENYPRSYVSIIEKDFTIGLTMGQEFKRLNLNPSDFMGRTIDEVFPEHANIIKENYAKAFEGEDQSFELLSDTQYQLYKCVPLISEHGAIDRILVVVENITEKKHLETTLHQSQKMESIGTLAGGIAHDFNNILSSIIGFTELALAGAQKGSEIEEDMQEVLNAGRRAKDLVKQILTFARQSDEVIKPVKILTVAEEVLKFIRSSIPTTIEIRQHLNSDSFMMGSPTQIHQVLMNLCTNAAQSMEEKGGILEVRVEDTTIDQTIMSSDLTKGEYIRIEIVDTGTGIPAALLNSIFDPYFTTKSVGEGTGMGLAVVHGIVEGYGGHIAVDSTMGKGTIFTVYLPITKKRKPHFLSEKQNLPTGTETILFVDDEAPIVKMLSKAFEQLGYSVTKKTSSLDALELFRSKPQAFDLVVTDMTMPNMTGDKLAQEVIKIRPDMPVILCTGYSKKISKERATQIGIKAFAYKPIVRKDLAETIRSVLDEAIPSK